MSLQLVSGFVLGIGMAATLTFMGIEIGKIQTTKDRNDDYVFNLLEESIEKDELIDELVRENKIYKKNWDKFNEERNSDYWG